MQQMIPLSVSEKIEEWSISLSDRIIEIRLFDIDQLRVSIKAHLKAAMYDCLRLQIPETERKLNELKSLICNGKNVKTIEQKIIETRQSLKEQNKLYSNLDRDNCAKEMTLWMRKYHNDSLQDFYKYYDQMFPNIHKKE